MNARKYIENFCKKNNIEIIRLEYILQGGCPNEAGYDSNFWELDCEYNGIKLAVDSYDTNVKSMLNDLQEEISQESEK